MHYMMGKGAVSAKKDLVFSTASVYQPAKEIKFSLTANAFVEKGLALSMRILVEFVLKARFPIQSLKYVAPAQQTKFSVETDAFVHKDLDS